LQHPVDERLPLEVGKLAKNDAASEVGVAIRIAAGATERALARDLDREIRPIAAENAFPGAKYRCGFHVVILRTTTSEDDEDAGVDESGKTGRVGRRRSGIPARG
jgi:hypothetical protein